MGHTDDASNPTPDGVPYEAMFMASPLPASLSRERDGCLLAVNEAWLDMTGLRREQAIGHTTVALGHWSSEAERQAYLNTVAQGPSIHPLRMVQAQQRHYRLHTRRLDVAPEPLLLVFLIDVTAQLEAESALCDANLRLQQQVELHGAIEKLTASGHWTNAENDDEVVWSGGLRELSGLGVDGRISRALGRSCIHPDDMPRWLAAREAMDGRTIEFRWERPDNGKWLWLRSRMGRTAVAGNPQTGFGVVQDVTAEKQVQQELAQQLAIVRGTTARVPGMLYQARLNADGTSSFPFASAFAAEMFELDPYLLQQDARLVFTRIHPEDKKRVASTLEAAGREGAQWQQSFRVLLPRKGLRWYSVNALPEPGPDGAVVWYGFASDVTEARLAEQAMQRQHRMLQAVEQAQAAFIGADDKRLAFTGLLDALLAVTRSEYGFVAEVLYDEAGQPFLRTHAVSNIAWDDASRRMYESQLDTGMEFRNLNTLFGHALRTQEPVISNDPAHDTRSAGVPWGHRPMNAFLGVPISLGDRMVAMVGLANQPGGYIRADVDFLQPLLGAVRQLIVAWRGHEERRRARQQLEVTSALLAERTRALQATFDSISQGMSLIGPDGRVLFYNQRMLELLDLPEALMAAHPLAAEVTEFQRQRGDFDERFARLSPAAAEYMQDVWGRPAPEVYLRTTRDGRTLEILTRQLGDGGMVRTFTDVTAFAKAEAALQSERQRLAWVLEATRPGIWESDLVTGEMQINDRWAGMLGYTVAELLPTTIDTWRRLVHPDDLARAQRTLEGHWRDEVQFYECDIRMRHKSGEWIWINDRGRVHRRGPDGRALYMSGTHLDIHERVVAQEQVRALNATLERRVAERTAALERSMKDMEATSYSIAHDLRAPLRAVNGFAALIAEEGAEAGLSPVARDMFQRITRSSRNMGQMLTDMLELLRVVRVDLAPVPVDMSALAAAALESHGEDPAAVDIVLRPLPAVMGDALLLRQVINNLLDNALKYSRHRERPRIELGFDAARQAFYLRDNGMGFDMARADKLFGLFQRLHPGSDVPGTGVGLAIVARIVERHSGRIWAESRPGEGATFWWTLPLA